MNPERSCYLTLTTDERVPRVSVTSEPRPGAISAGPLRSRGEAQAAAAAIRSSFRLRSCRPALPEDDGSCLAGLLGRCAAPCRGGAAVQEYARGVAAAAGWLRGEDGGTVASGLRMRMTALGADRRFEEAAQLRDQLEALERVRSALGRLRAAAGRSGVLLAADTDDRFVQAFACAGGRVVGRRRLPRAGDAALECAPLIAPLRSALRARPAPLRPDQADVAHLIAAAFARPGRSVVAVPLGPDAMASAASYIAMRRARVPLRR